MTTVTAGRPDAVRLSIACAALAAICILVYGGFITQLGFYLDDWPLIWAYKTSGVRGITAYYQGDRPFSGEAIAAFFGLFGASRVAWHALAVALSAVTSVVLFVTLRALFPEKSSDAWLVAALVSLYPGFSLQALAVTFLPHQLALLLYLLSLLATMAAIRARRFTWALVVLALAAEALGYLIVEYFIGLEVLRLLVIWLTIGSAERLPRRQMLRRSIMTWLPYLAALMIYVTYKASYHTWNSPTHDVKGQLTAIIRHPLAEIARRAALWLHNVLMSTIVAWARPVSAELVDFDLGRWKLMGFLWLVSGVIGCVAAWTYQGLSGQDEQNSDVNGVGLRRYELVCVGVVALVFGALPMLFAGPGITFDPNDFLDRFSLPCALGSCAVLVGMLRSLGLRRYGIGGAVFALGFLFASFQIRSANHFREDWAQQKALVWQLAWRIPSMQKGSSVFIAGLPPTLRTSHSAGILNLLYNPHDTAPSFDYLIFDLNAPIDGNRQSFVLGDMYVPSLRRDAAVMGRLRSYLFQGNTSQAIVAWNSPSGTLRVLDTSVASEIWECPPVCRAFAHLSNPQSVIGGERQTEYGPLLAMFGSEPEHGWTYFYQKAALARQRGRWEDVSEQGDSARIRRLSPSDPSEWHPFIEGYAMSGQEAKAVQLTDSIVKSRPTELAWLSALWQEVLCRRRSDADVLEQLRGSLGAELMLGDHCAAVR